MFWCKKSNPKENMRLNERALRQTNRQIAGDCRSLEKKNKELEFEIKKLAQLGQKEACSVLAKQLLKLRKQEAKSLNMGARMNAISAKNRAIYSLGQMASAVEKVTNTSKIMEKQLPAGKLDRNLHEFVKTQECLGVTEETVSNTLYTMLEESNDDEEYDTIVRKILDEIDIDLNTQLSMVPQIPCSSAAAIKPSNKLASADLEKLLSE